MSLPPPGWVPITPTRWAELAEACQQPIKSKRLLLGDRVVGWHRTRQWYACPHGYRQALRAWPDGWVPGLESRG